MENMMNKLPAALYSFLAVYTTAMVTTYLVHTGLVDFYDYLDKPLITPSHDYFRYVWNIIYFLLFTGFYMALTSKQDTDQFLDLNALFIIQLFLQIIWAYCFFYLQQINTGAFVIILLDIVGALLMHSLLFINLLSFFFILPYFLWLLFATYLNIFLIFLN